MRRARSKALRLVAATEILQKEQARLAEILAAVAALREITVSHPVLNEIAWQGSVAKVLREQERVIGRAERFVERIRG